jgi:hypothetical protein
VFLVPGEIPAVRSDGPPIVGLHCPRGPGNEHGLNGDHEALRQPISRKPILIVRHLRILVDTAADAVTTEFADHRESVTASLEFYRTPDDGYATACPRDAKCSA